MADRIDYLVFAVLCMALCGGLMSAARGTSRLRLRAAWGAIGAVALCAVVAFPLTDHLGEQARQRIERMLGAYAPTYAADLTDMGHAALSLQTPPDDPGYLTMIEAQKRWLAVNPNIADIYTFRRNEQGELMLILDSETDNDRNGIYDDEREARTDIGEVYEDAENPQLQLAFEGVAAFDDVIYTDRWGTWVSAYAPMFDAQGRVEAVLGVDFDATEFTARIAWARFTALSYMGLIVLIVAGGGAGIMQLAGALDRARRAETAASASNAALTELLARSEAMTRELAASKEAAEAASHAKSAFLANMSHEIRTPLSTVLGYTQLLLSGTLSPIEVNKSLSAIDTHGRQLFRLISDMLDISKIEAGRMTVERINCDVVALLGAAVDATRGPAQAKGLHLELDLEEPLPATIESDPVRLQQIITNLLNNAVKFTSSGCIRVSARWSPVGGNPDTAGSLQIRVTDTGIGIRPEHVSRLFQPFMQADDSTTRVFGGTGLGLSICRRLLDLLGGAIDLESTGPAGSTFCITLPVPRDTVRADLSKWNETARQGTAREPGAHHTGAAGADAACPACLPDAQPAMTPGETSVPTENSVPSSPSPAAPSSPAPSSPAPDRPTRVLLVEDHAVNRMMVEMMLRKAGVTVTTAEDGRQAVDRAWSAWQEQGGFDLVLMDMQMPVMDGYAATRELRRLGYTGRIVALTANAMTGDRERCIEAGCDDFLSKPVDRTRLADELSRLGHRAAAA